MRVLYVVLVLAVFVTGCNPSDKTDANKVRIIFDTDIGPDYDDVGAITMVHAFADSGKADILATIASSRYEGVASVIDLFNTYFKRPDIPIGVPGKNAVEDRDKQHWTDSILSKYPYSIKSNSDVPSATEVYRKILASEADTSVTIVTVGFLTNLSDLLNSPPDEYSKDDGVTLVRRKVRMLISMAGKFPEGREYNIWRDHASAREVIHRWPTPITFSGFEVGVGVKTGLPLVHSAAIRKSPVKDVYRISIPLDKDDRNGRSSWDQTAVLAAFDDEKAYFDRNAGLITIRDDGSNGWDTLQGTAKHFQLAPKVSADSLASVIDRLMMHQP
jgi:pyrimidine-specific ribonucleoside hydrolase